MFCFGTFDVASERTIRDLGRFPAPYATGDKQFGVHLVGSSSEFRVESEAKPVGLMGTLEDFIGAPLPARGQRADTGCASISTSTVSSMTREDDGDDGEGPPQALEDESDSISDLHQTPEDDADSLSDFVPEADDDLEEGAEHPMVVVTPPQTAMESTAFAEPVNFPWSSQDLQAPEQDSMSSKSGEPIQPSCDCPGPPSPIGEASGLKDGDGEAKAAAQLGFENELGTFATLHPLRQLNTALTASSCSLNSKDSDWEERSGFEAVVDTEDWVVVDAAETRDRQTGRGKGRARPRLWVARLIGF